MPTTSSVMRVDPNGAIATCAIASGADTPVLAAACRCLPELAGACRCSLVDVETRRGTTAHRATSPPHRHVPHADLGHCDGVPEQHSNQCRVVYAREQAWGSGAPGFCTGCRQVPGHFFPHVLGHNTHRFLPFATRRITRDESASSLRGALPLPNHTPTHANSIAPLGSRCDAVRQSQHQHADRGAAHACGESGTT